MNIAIEITDVSKRFGPVTAVDALNLRIEEGAFVGLLGRNGAGKSTIINMATGLLTPSAGRIRVLGLDIKHKAIAIKGQIGVMPQDEGQLDCLTGPQYLDLVGRLYGLTREVIEGRRQELFGTLELEPEPGALIREYSYGMRKKLALCAALVHGPKVLFLDEPFEGIDPLTARTIKEILLRLQKKGVTVLMSSHMIEVVERLCPVIIIIERGRLVCSGSLEDIRAEHGDGASLESLFVELMGGARQGELSWL